MVKRESVTVDDLMKQVKTYIHNPKDLKEIQKAIDYVYQKHEGQMRKSGEPYTIHLLHVAYILSTLHVSPTTLVAGLLHDVIEDTEVTFEEVSKEFSLEVANLVESVTKIGNIQFKDEKEYLAENHRKILIAMAKDIRVIYIKLVDRLHNMRTLQFHTVDKQKKIAQETLSVYAPIAHRLGISEIKNELEDLSFFYLNTTEYYDIAKKLELKKVERDNQVQNMIDEINEMLNQQHIAHVIFGRSKHLYSIYKKMHTKNKRFDEILDLMAIRIITKTELNCYEILGFIHAKYRPIPGRLKDYIAMPKMNMYQSLHTTIVGEDGFIFEVQIRTEQMDEIAERGVAAHWRYKEGEQLSAKDNQRQIEEKLAWFRDLDMSSDEINNDATHYMESLQKDVFEANVYVMTPKGRVFDLPNGSTPIDFAYRIHSEVGEKTIGATVNGALVPLNTKLKTGDVVDIRTTKTSNGPSEDWLKFVVTNRARNRIRNYFIKKAAEDREKMVAKGEAMFKDECRKRKLDEKEMMSKDRLEQIYNGFSLKNYDDFMNAIAVKSLSLQAVFERLGQKQKVTSENELEKIVASIPSKSQKVSKSGLRVEGIDSMMISVANCCRPVYGEKIIGYITKGKGIKVHRQDCPNIAHEKARLIPVEWDEDFSGGRYEVPLEVHCLDRQFLLTDIVTLTSQHNVSITYVSAAIDADKVHCTISLKVSVKDASDLRILMANLKKVDSVLAVERTIL